MVQLPSAHMVCVYHVKASTLPCPSVQGCNELERLPQPLLVLVLSRLDQRELFGVAPLVCKAWQGAAQQAAQQLQLNLSYLAALGAQPRFVQLMHWVHHHGQQLQQLHLCSSAPLGESNRCMLLRCLAPQYQGLLREPWPLQGQELPAAAVLQLQQLTLQLDLEVEDVDFIADYVCAHAPMLQHLKLQPLKASLADLQLMVIACILGSLVGVDSLGEGLQQGSGWIPPCLSWLFILQSRLSAHAYGAMHWLLQTCHLCSVLLHDTQLLSCT